MNLFVIHCAAPLMRKEGADTGVTISAGAGYYTRLEMYRSEGIQFDPEKDITLEMFEAADSRIVDMTGAKPFRGNMSAIEEKLKALGRV